MFNYARRKVSLNKKRYQQDGFDLDLTYITPTIVAMGFPATGIEALYRNPRPQVQRLLEKKHKGHYKVYNLCIEPKWSYDPSVFQGRVSRYPFADHQAPPLSLMKSFCEDVEKWLSDDEQNMAAVHCKAGKGRAGMMICCWLLHSGVAATADEAMTKYAEIRTKDAKGVTIPSQRRYVCYYEEILRYGMPEPPTIRLKKVIFGSSNYNSKSIPLICDRKEIYRSPVCMPQPGADLHIEVDDLKLAGDVKVEFHKKNSKKKPICHTWFNTAFVDGNKIFLKKPEIDVAWKDKKCKKFNTDFTIELRFGGAKVGVMAGMKAKGIAAQPNKKSSKKKKRDSESKRRSKRKSHSEKSNGRKSQREPEKKKEKDKKAKEEKQSEEEEKKETVKEKKVKKGEEKENGKKDAKEEKKVQKERKSKVKESKQEADKPKEEKKKPVPVAAEDSSSSSESEEESKKEPKLKEFVFAEDSPAEETKVTPQSEKKAESSSDSSEGEEDVNITIGVQMVKVEEKKKEESTNREESSDSSSESESDSEAKKAKPTTKSEPSDESSSESSSQ